MITNSSVRMRHTQAGGCSSVHPPMGHARTSSAKVSVLSNVLAFELTPVFANNSPPADHCAPSRRALSYERYAILVVV